MPGERLPVPVAGPEPPRSELRALGALAGEMAGELVGLVQGVHRAVAARSFGLTTVAGAPARLAHDAISTGVYAALGGAGRVAGTAAGAALAASRRSGHGRELTSTPGGALAVGAINGLIGDRLEAEGSELAVEMAFHPAPPDEPGPSVAVFVHGLGESDAAWRLGGDPTYGELLRRDLGHTPLYLRYNTGLEIAENGRRLSALLEETVRNWPVEVEELVLVGHSMGGIVARHACRAGGEGGARWIGSLRHAVCLGSPLGGAPLAKAVSGASGALAALAETEPFARFLDLRSAGIRDLCITCDAPPFEGAGAHYACATITARAEHPLGRALGDLLVRQASASGGSDQARHFGGRHHFDLLNDPGVYQALRAWLSDPAALEGASPQSCSSR